MQLTDEYVVLKRIGRGGFGTVFLVKHRKTGEVYAAKMLSSPNDPIARARFEREVKQLRRYASFRYVVRLFREYLDADVPFFIMKHARGGAATPWAGKLSERQVLTLMRQLMETLVAIHADGGFHRDVKPDNLLLVDERTSALADFGLGNSPNCTVHFTMSEAGTPGYAAPELVAGGTFTAACDIYSAGATWFHSISGRHPRDVAGPLNVLAFRPKVDPIWVDCLGAMTNRDPNRRPSAFQVLRLLQGTLQGKEANLPHSSPTSPWAVVALVCLTGLMIYGLAKA